MIYTITANPSLDYYIRLDELKIGEINRSTSEELKIGGKGINVSQALLEMGLPSTAVGLVAGFTGKEIVEGLGDKRIEFDLTECKKGKTRINVKVLGQEETQINGQGLDVDEEEFSNFLLSLDQIEDSDWVVVSGSQFKDKDFTRRMFENLDGLNLIVDLAGEDLEIALDYEPFFLKINKREAEDFLGRKLNSDGEILRALVEFSNLGAENILITDSNYGGYYLGDRYFKVKTKHFNESMTIGAGDTAMAGLVYGILMCSTYEDAVKYSLAAGSMRVKTGQFPKLYQIDDLIPQLEVEDFEGN